MRKFSWKVSESLRGQRLDQALSVWIPEALGKEVSKGKVRKLIVAGAVYLNRKRVRIASKLLLPGAVVEVYIDEKKLFELESRAPQKTGLKAGDILWEDEFLIIVNKPAGLPTQPTLDESRANLFQWVKNFLKERDHEVDPYVGLHHRLDRDTSGVIFFTKKKAANKGIAQIFQEHLAQKEYQALVAATRTSHPGSLRPELKWTIQNYLGKRKDAGKRTLFQGVRSGGDPAETAFECLQAGEGWAWVTAFPKTGRTHQIRVHLSESGWPILGDPAYWPQGLVHPGSEVPPRLMLHAKSLTFPHPVSGESVRVESPLPVDFERCLKHLQAGSSPK